MNKISKGMIVLFFLCLIACIVFLMRSEPAGLRPSVVVTLAALAMVFSGHPILKRFTFTVWVFVFVFWSLFYPSAFGSWFGIDLKILIVPLIQIIMFGMGTTLSLKDFKRIVTMPWPVFIGMILQFTVMPLAGFTIAYLFHFDPEIAAGVILVGTCPGGVASNLMTFLANGNVALSVTMTSCSTLMSPLVTPFMMKTLAGKLVPIDFVDMMFSILNMIIVPIVAGLVANMILYKKHPMVHRKGSLGVIGFIGILFGAALIWLDPGFLGSFAVLRNGLILGCLLIGIVALSKLVVTLLLNRTDNWMSKVLPMVSMFGICFIIAIITARSSDQLMAVGAALIVAAVLHNFIGYSLGYWISRAIRLDERDCRTVAFEVGMQNGGMATGLAMTVLNSSDAALAPAIFGPWMNVSGSSLATYWHRKGKQDQESMGSTAIINE
jgi:BASS family bile acid:Na+ symporter